jgi:hypothetical protein
MSPARVRLALVVTTLAVVVGIPLAGWWARRGEGPRCAFDGQPVAAAYRVRVADRGGDAEFCCVHCARLWLARRDDPPEAVYVTDEATGEEIDARAAVFVRSTVVTNPVTGNRVHAFRDRTAADEHVRSFGGWVLSGAERPFPAEPALAEPDRPER